jgi:hypothetical protein
VVTARASGCSLRHVATAATRTYYWFVADHAATNNCAITRFIAGTSTRLLTFTQAFTDGAEWEFRAVGPATATVLTVFLNGVQVGQVTDNSSLAAGAPGLAFSSPETSASIDDWTGNDRILWTWTDLDPLVVPDGTANGIGVLVPTGTGQTLAYSISWLE